MISFEKYFDRTVSVFLQFDLTRKALRRFRDTPEAVEGFAKDELESIRTDMKEHFEKTGRDPASFWLGDEEQAQKYLASTYESVPKRLADVEKRLEQNEFIIRMALFESFMKDVHCEALRQKPTLLKPTRQIPLGRLLAVGLGSILEEEIEREVHSLSRMDAKSKSDYFKNTLGIDYSFDDKIIPLVEGAVATRNKILHEDPDAEIDRFAYVSVRIIGLAIPLFCVAQGSILYPGGFEVPKHSEEMIAYFKKKMQMAPGTREAEPEDGQVSSESAPSADSEEPSS